MRGRGMVNNFNILEKFNYMLRMFLPVLLGNWSHVQHLVLLAFLAL